MRMFMILGAGLVAMVLLITLSPPEGLKVNADDCSITHNGHEFKALEFIVSNGHSLRELDFKVVDCWSNADGFTQFLSTDNKGNNAELAIWMTKDTFDSWNNQVKIYFTDQDGTRFVNEIPIQDFYTKPTVFALPFGESVSEK